MGLTPDLSRRYLRAMGVQVWRSRDVAETADSAPVLEPAGTLDHGPLTDTKEVLDPPVPETPIVATDLEWDRLRAEVAACRACSLCETRTQTVFGVGNRTADLMIVGEAPGADEDRVGEPFVGRAGQLLNLMLAAIGLRRDQVYIANILKCRPPGNRDPSPEEALRCEPFLMHQMELVRPRLVLSLGRVSAQNLLRTGMAVGRLRGQWFALGPEKVPLAVTYHPAYLLRSPKQKSLVWQDLQRVARRMRELQNPSAGRGVGC